MLPPFPYFSHSPENEPEPNSLDFFINEVKIELRCSEAEAEKVFYLKLFYLGNMIVNERITFNTTEESANILRLIGKIIPDFESCKKIILCNDNLRENLTFIFESEKINSKAPLDKDLITFLADAQLQIEALIKQDLIKQDFKNDYLTNKNLLKIVKKSAEEVQFQNVEENLFPQPITKRRIKEKREKLEEWYQSEIIKEQRKQEKKEQRKRLEEQRKRLEKLYKLQIIPEVKKIKIKRRNTI
jgi:hypothetical protein